MICPGSPGRYLAAALLLAAAALGAGASEDESIPLTSECVVRFATLEEARDVLTRPDDFILSLSEFDRAARMRVPAPVTQEAFLAFLGQQAREWTPQERSRVSRAIESIRSEVLAINPRLPAVIYLVRTSGKEESGANYTRGEAIIVPKPPTDAVPTGRDILPAIMAHELFHVYTRHNQEKLAELYGILGFRMCDDIHLPKALAPLKVTNPDAPWLNVYIQVEANNQVLMVTPFLLARSAYDPQLDIGSFLDYMSLKLLVVEETSKGVLPLLDDSGGASVLDPADVPDYEKRASQNTGYTIHPEEVLAVNFSRMVVKKPVAAPWVLDEIKRIISRPVAEAGEGSTAAE